MLRLWLMAALVSSGCVVRHVPAAYADWKQDPYAGKGVLTSSPMERPIQPGNGNELALRTELRYVEGDEAATMLTTLFTGKRAGYRGLDCRELSAAVDDAPWTLSLTRAEAVLPATVKFESTIPLAELERLRSAKSLKVRVCDLEVEYTDSELQGPDLWVAHAFVTRLDERRSGARPSP